MKLHEKKISELKVEIDWDILEKNKGLLKLGWAKKECEKQTNKQLQEKLKQWAIAVVKDIRKREKNAVGNVDKINSVAVQLFLIDRFEITEKELEG